MDTQISSLPKKRHNTAWFTLALLAAGALFAVYFVPWPSANPINYTILGVPPITIFSEGTNGSEIEYGGIPEVVSILRYWGDTVGFVDKPAMAEIRRIFHDSNYESMLDADGEVIIGKQFADIAKQLVAYFDQRGYFIRIDEFDSIDDFKPFISPGERTPLLVAMPFSELTQRRMYRILIGIQEDTATLIFHDYLLGNNYEMSFGTFNAIMSKEPGIIKFFFAIRPNNYREVLSTRSITEDYPPRPEMAKRVEGIWDDYVLGLALANPGRRETLLLRTIERPEFSLLHPFLAQHVYLNLMTARVDLGKFDAARESLDEVNRLIAAISQPYEGWPLYIYPFEGRFPSFYRALSKYYSAVGDTENLRKTQALLEASFDGRL